jgi:hypothetical protein
VFSSPLVATAYAVAARAHAGQFCKNGDPVLSHAAATAEVLAQLGLPDTIVAAGLLHDVLCDTSMTACQLEEYLPREVVTLVEKVRGPWGCRHGRWRAEELLLDPLFIPVFRGGSRCTAVQAVYSCAGCHVLQHSWGSMLGAQRSCWLAGLLPG